MIGQGIVLAAGLGQRMRPLSNDIPKPLVRVHGRPIIDYALDALTAAGVKRIVVNAHYKSEVLEAHLKANARPCEIVISHEPALLDSGGGIKQALSFLDRTQPVFVLAGDSILLDPAGDTSLRLLEDAWDGTRADILLSLQPLATMTLTQGVGDYTMQGGRPVRTPDHSGEYMWNSARILHPRIFEDTPEGPFSFLTLMDRAESRGRLAALIHSGDWHHLTTPDDVARVNAEKLT